MDIILFAILAAFLLFRLWSVLGSRTGNNDPLNSDRFNDSLDDENFNAGFYESSPEKTGRDPFKEAKDQTNLDVFSNFQDAEQKVANLIPGFNLESFVKISEKVFEKIITAYNNKDLETLKDLLAKEIYLQFESDIADRRDHLQDEDHCLDRVIAEPYDIQIIDNRVAQVTIRFESEHTTTTKDNQGKPVDVHYTNRELWTFEKDSRSFAPTWFLVKTCKD